MGDSVQVVPVVSRTRGRVLLGLPWWQTATIAALIVWLYGSTLVRLFVQFYNDKNTSHGFFVPLFSLFLIWQDRENLAQVRRSPSWLGIPVILGSLLMLTVGRLGAEIFLARTSLLFLLAGLIITLGGWSLFRALLFPWAFLFLMIPIPALLLQKVTFPLQLLTSRVSAKVLELLYVPVLREGNLITLPRMPLEVAQACSGIRSLLSLITLAVIYGYLMDNRKWVRVALALLAIPIAVAANSLRVVGTGLLVQHWDPDKAEGFYHTFEGWLIFVVSLVMLFIVHGLIRRIWGGDPGPKPASKPSSFPTSFSDHSSLPRFAMVAFFMIATGTLLEAHSQNEVFPPREPLSSLPSHFGSWTGQDIALDNETLDILGHPELLFRDYDAAQDLQPSIELLIAYYPSQRAGEAPHSPSHCLPGSGWTPSQRQIIQIQNSDGTTFRANRYVVSKAGERQMVVYWYLAHGRGVASEYSAKYQLICDSIRMNRSDGALIRFTTQMLHGETPEAAQSRVLAFASNILPDLNRYIPR